MCLSRRHFLGTGLGGFLAYATRNGASDLLFGQDVARAKACIVLWMEGGPSHIDTFDPKTGPTAGEFKSIETAARGVRIGEHLPKIAAQMKNLSIVRSLTSSEGEHQRATYLWHTGHPQIEGIVHPSAGAVVSKEISKDPVAMPRYVSVGSSGQGAASSGRPRLQRMSASARHRRGSHRTRSGGRSASHASVVAVHPLRS